MFVAIEALDGVGKGALLAGLKERGWLAMATPGDELRPFMAAALDITSDQTGRCLLYAQTVVRQGQLARAASDNGHNVVMDRYWLSTISYARARRVAADLTGVERLVPIPDITVLLVLNEQERVRRMTGRGGMTAADAETLNPAFRAVVMAEMTRSGRPAGLTPVVVDITGVAPEEVAERVTRCLAPAGDAAGRRACG